MNKNRILKNSMLLFCILFTVFTLISSIISLTLNKTIETHIHILDRAVLTLMGSFIFNIMIELKSENKILNFILPYLLFMSLALIYVYISGFFVNLHKNAYRDIFINDTIIYIVVFIVYRKFKIDSK